MRLYTVTDKNKNIVAWAGTQGDAIRSKKELGAKAWQLCDVPTSKPEFLEFLNEHAVAPADPENNE